MSVKSLVSSNFFEQSFLAECLTGLREMVIFAFVLYVWFVLPVLCVHFSIFCHFFPFY